ncbi:unnamed protein product [Amaranthus hypochondriacus]
MGEHMKAEDWLPEGWKVEIRIRKSGKKDRYYTDPVNGYIFRSLKDIDRYLLSGKLGKHVTKNKLKNIDSTNERLDFAQPTDNIRGIKKFVESNGAEKVEFSLEITDVKGKKTDAENPEETEKKNIRRPSKGGRNYRPKKKRESTPFFILDPDQCQDSNALSIPNISEIIDSMLKEKEGSKSVYLSAPDIGSLIGEKLSETSSNDSNKKLQFGLNMCKNNGTSPCIPSELILKNEDWESRSLTRPYHLRQPAPEKRSRNITENQGKEEDLGCSGFVDLFDDPCIDFAIKTLTGNISLNAKT